jgi:hypothetical protein
MMETFSAVENVNLNCMFAKFFLSYAVHLVEFAILSFLTCHDYLTKTAC